GGGIAAGAAVAAGGEPRGRRGQRRGDQETPGRAASRRVRGCHAPTVPPGGAADAAIRTGPAGPERSELLAVVAADDAARLRLARRSLGREAGVGLDARPVPGVEVLPHGVEAALRLRPRP